LVVIAGQITSSTDLNDKPILPNKMSNQPDKDNNEGPRQSSTPHPCMEEDPPTTSEPVTTGSNDDLNRENSSNSSVDSSWSKISEEDLKQNNGKKTAKGERCDKIFNYFQLLWVAWVAYAANASSCTTVVPKVRGTGSSSADTICELRLFDVLFSPIC
jgi:hypothetical protein